MDKEELGFLNQLVSYTPMIEEFKRRKNFRRNTSIVHFKKIFG